MKKQEYRNKLILCKALKKLSPEEFILLIPYLDDKAIDELCSCVYNTLFQNRTISTHARAKILKKINPHKNKYLYLSKKDNDTNKKRTILKQHGSGIGMILSAAIPFLMNLIGGK